MKKLQGKTLVITGASRGIGRQIALRCAADGANIVIAAKSTEPHPKLPGTIYTVAEEVQALGGKALPIQMDVRDEAQVQAMVKQVKETFGGADVLINNAGAISLTSVEKTPLKRYDLMQQINSRAVFLCSQALLPLLRESDQAHILNLSPPLNLDPKWFKEFSPYTLSKYGMSILTIGMAQEFRDRGISVNALWPRTLIATAAVEFAVADKQAFERSRTPEIMADAAYEIITTADSVITGRTLLDEEILRERGVDDFQRYAWNPDCDGLELDIFVD